ncbi:sensor histidine kinase [Archangium primigenium]|uniref:sensor histidine kinase n=1 Tax=[Archangium] primigenium TaxID=2792470 RepID=UPI00195F1835|nr:HAMP domain-containing sensor histidine kinase [Archangium primigenium]MBM7117879.1 HAMP domain-containing histidine kinase [Archangium primigenium]
MTLDLLQAIQLSWSPQLRVTRVTGDCERVLRRPAAQILDRPLETVLGTSAEHARRLDTLARRDERAVEFLSGVLGPEDPVPLRFALGLEAGEATAVVLDLRALLRHAPPVQLSGLASQLSHELRNPLSSVKMAVQTLARNTGLSERDQRRLTIANREVRTLERMLWLLSEYARDSTPTLEPHAPRTLVEEAMAMVAPELTERGVTVRVDEAADVPRVRMDTNRLRPVLAQVLLNLAMSQAQGGQVVVTLRPEPPGRVSLSWRDPSGTLSEQESASLFEPFASSLARGTGLSLAALRRVLVHQGGEVVARSESGPDPDTGAEAGTVFTLTFVV